MTIITIIITIICQASSGSRPSRSLALPASQGFRKDWRNICSREPRPRRHANNHVELKCCKRTCAYHALRARVCQVSPGAWVGLLQGGILAACAKAGMRHNQGRQASDAASGPAQLSSRWLILFKRRHCKGSLRSCRNVLAGMLQPCGFTLSSLESSWSVLPLSGSTRYKPCILKQREMVCPPRLSSTEASRLNTPRCLTASIRTAGACHSRSCFVLQCAPVSHRLNTVKQTPTGATVKVGRHQMRHRRVCCSPAVSSESSWSTWQGCQ